MVTIACPWCDEDAALLFALLEEQESTFRCPECGTAVDIVDEGATALEMAA